MVKAEVGVPSEMLLGKFDGKSRDGNAVRNGGVDVYQNLCCICYI